MLYLLSFLKNVDFGHIYVYIGPMCMSMYYRKNLSVSDFKFLYQQIFLLE